MDKDTKDRMLEAFGIAPKDQGDKKRRKEAKLKKKLRKEIDRENQQKANEEFMNCQPSKLIRDIQVLEGMPPYDTGSNHCRGDGYFAKDLRRRIKKAGKNFDTLREEAKAIARKQKPGWDR